MTTTITPEQAKNIEHAKMDTTPASPYRRAYLETPSIASLPKHYRRTSQKPLVIDGIEWRSYHVGIAMYSLVAELAGRRAEITRNYMRMTYSAWLDGKPVGQRYRSGKAAARAISRALKELSSLYTGEPK